MFRKLLASLALLGFVILIPTGSSTLAQSTSTFFASTSIEPTQTIVTQSYGDLWPSCWSDDDNLYAADGDGRGFSLDERRSDIVVSQISGDVDHLTGSAIAKGDQVASVWSDPKNYNRKPTGMLCVDDTLYLAVQDLSTVKDAQGKAHNDAPAASISKSTDHGKTWTWDKQAPMFSNHVFTTIFFLDYGKNNANVIDQYVYVYGIDYNWHESDGTVPNPVDLYLARVTPDNLQTISAWQFYSGVDASGNPTWSSNIADRAAVLHDARLVHGHTVISQGGVVYDQPLNRYIYTSWTGSTYEFYEAPAPWGPWNLFVSKDFGEPQTASSYGGYATTIPSKFISADGETLWIQSDNCTPCGTTVGNYAFSLRKFEVVPSDQIKPAPTRVGRIQPAAPTPTSAG